MKSILLGSLICLSIIIITIFILSFQHVTLPYMIEVDDESDNEEDTDDDSSEKQKDDEEKETKNNALLHIGDDAGKTKDVKIENNVELKEDEPQKINVDKNLDDDATCCFVNRYNCNGSECTSGIQKRCGYFAEKSCKDSLVLCDLMNENDCMLPPNNKYCSYDVDKKKCLNVPNAHDGMEIDCATYDRYKKAGFMHTEYNCEVPLFLS